MLEVQHLSVRAGSFTLSDLNLRVADRTCCVLIGKNGAGKTVFLETLAGRHQITGGKVLWNGTDITRFPPEKRRIALVYQYYALFPHLSVAQNISFPMKTAGQSRLYRENHTEELLSLFSLTSLADRRPQTLSGGERQRTALARALAAEPELLLLDEPLCALDCVTKDQIKKVLYTMHEQFGTTVIQVTHDFDEAYYFADSFAVMTGSTLSEQRTRAQLLALHREDLYGLLDGSGFIR
ncbi:MAG: ATP-binding cassette domain-containing protein [Treponema sp.]|nr:ATP-binding cassette domain-containing protein [Treponema sp.]